LKINNWRRKALEREFWERLGEEEAKTKIGITEPGRERNETTENFKDHHHAMLSSPTN
jgi:hypothetical protein